MVKTFSMLFAAFFILLAVGCGAGGSGSDRPAIAPLPPSAKAITAFSFTSPAATGIINESVKTISVTVPSGTMVTALVATFTTTGATVKVGSTIQISGSTPNNFTAPVSYTVTAADNTTAVYTVTVTAAAPITGALIVDHTSVAAFDSIPPQWLEAAKQLTLHYGHTSHGSQIISGIEALENANATYSVAIGFYSTVGLPPQEYPPALRIYRDSMAPDSYWTTNSGLPRTRAAAATNLFNFSMWSWCGEQSGNSEATVQEYLDNLNTLENEFPAMRFIYMTGHTDGGTSTLIRNNNMVRNYVTTNNKVLFDFADIESYDPDGNYYVNDNEGNCTWCASWCSSHPADCTNLPSSCAHSHPYACKQKAKAFWYMMARLAGWDGN